jgi:hypothetical protein
MSLNAIHLMKGIRFWRNPKNKLPCLEVHYTADPDKDPITEKGREWFEEATENMSEADIEREMEINWNARGGKRFYGEFKREMFRPAPLNPFLPTIFRCWDFGYHHPAVMYLQTDTKNTNYNDIPRTYIIKCIQGEDIEFEDFLLRQILPVFRNEKTAWDEPYVIKDCCDIAGLQKNPMTNATCISLMAKHGVYPIYTKKGIKYGTDRVRNLIKSGQIMLNSEDEGCVFLSHGFFGGYIFEPTKPGITKKESEKPEDGNIYGHLMDGLRYFVVNFLDIVGLARSLTNEPRPKRTYHIPGPGNSRRRRI